MAQSVFVFESTAEFFCVAKLMIAICKLNALVVDLKAFSNEIVIFMGDFSKSSFVRGVVGEDGEFIDPEFRFNRVSEEKMHARIAIPEEGIAFGDLFCEGAKVRGGDFKGIEI